MTVTMTSMEFKLSPLELDAERKERTKISNRVVLGPVQTSCVGRAELNCN